MEIVKKKSKIRKLCSSGKNRVLIPTMGSLHEGHLSLIKTAREKINNPYIIVSIFLNPTQFDNTADFDKYPVSLKDDLKKLKANKIDAVFIPDIKSIYPKGFSTYVFENKLSDKMEGKYRKKHFQGVCTIVLKLFNIIKPSHAIFGKKDYQQLLIIKKVVKDLDLDIKIIGSKTIREEDGLALSSRNINLSKNERKDSINIYKCLKLAQKNNLKDAESVDDILKNSFNYLNKKSFCKIDYIKIFDKKSLQIINGNQRPKNAIMAIAVKYPSVRLIDNISLG